MLTEDKDFGWLIYASGEACPGVILIRFPATARATLARSILELVESRGAVLPGAFVVLQPGILRIEPRA